jgi:hypothetical protein
MKAKEYANLWNSWLEKPPTKGDVYNNAPEEEKDKPADDTDLVSHLCHKILQEYQPLARQRKAQSAEALGAILRELCQKYDAVCRRVEGLPSGFMRRFIDIIHKDVLAK